MWCVDWGEYSDLRASISGKDVPEDIKARLLALHEENVNLKEQYKTAQEKLLKARTVCRVSLCGMCIVICCGQFIKSQDKLFKEEQAAKLAGSAPVSCSSTSPVLYFDLVARARSRKPRPVSDRISRCSRRKSRDRR